MKRWHADRWALAATAMALVVGGCGAHGGSGGFGPDGGDPTDGASNPDVGFTVDLPGGMDGASGPDAGPPGLDGGPTVDLPVPPGDVSPLQDLPPAVDVPAGIDVPVATTVSMAVVANPASPGHPVSGTEVMLSDIDLVALSPRVLISGPGTTGTCAFALWVGTSRGGDFSAVEVFETVHIGTTGTGAAACFVPGVRGVIPETIAVGDGIGTLRGRADDYCASGMVCPAGAARELNLDAGLGTLVLGGGFRAVPPPTDVDIAAINGVGPTPAPRDLALQNTLVRVRGALLVSAPTVTNHDNMGISTTPGGPTISVGVARYIGVGCQRTALAAVPVGSSVGDVTGVLDYTFGAWLIQPRQASDLPSIVCADGGTGG